jgi:ERCC4-type nuclease
VGYKIIRDTREQKGWDFDKTADCLGFTVGKLDTGDYSVEGVPDLCVERKGCVGEIAGNFFEDRWEDVLGRMSQFKHSYIICEFELKDVVTYPYNMPKFLRDKIKVRGPTLLKKISEYEVKYGVRFVFAGKYGKQYFMSLAKRLCQK